MVNEENCKEFMETLVFSDKTLQLLKASNFETRQKIVDLFIKNGFNLDKDIDFYAIHIYINDFKQK